MKRRALTLMEVLVATSTLVLLALLSAPAIIRARAEAKKTRCASNLKQIFYATQLYRIDYNGSASGDAYTMGFPPSTVDLRSYSRTSMKSLQCSELPNEFIPATADGYIINVQSPDDGSEPSDLFVQMVAKYGEDKIIRMDMNHNPKSTPFFGAHFSHFGLGLTLGGSVVKRYKKGDWQDELWWHDF